jgi:hypothetical protein
MDTQCKGKRVCESGKCVDPTQAQVPSAPETAEADSASTVIPVCEPKDRRTRIPVWTPNVDSDGNLSSDPPQQDGQIVFIELWTDSKNADCKDSALNSFSRPTNRKDPMEGGLAVNLRGNTQFANGTCYFSGYYMNEQVMGIHQGWIETYFKAVDKEKVVLSDKFCLSRPTP